MSPGRSGGSFLGRHGSAGNFGGRGFGGAGLGRGGLGIGQRRMGGLGGGSFVARHGGWAGGNRSFMANNFGGRGWSGGRGWGNGWGGWGRGGFGRGFGYGIGYGLGGWGRGWGSPFGWGWGGFGYGFPYFGYGWGYPGFGYGFGVGSLVSSLAYGLGGYGGWGYGGYGGYGAYGNGYNDWGYYGTPVSTVYAVDNTAPVVNSGTAVASLDPTPASAASGSSGTFAEQGEAAFKAGDYKGAIYAWRHALVDDAQNPVLLMMIGQAFFANGQYNEAAGATQAAMQMSPKDNWGTVVTNFRDLYGNGADYTTQLRALEKAVKDKPSDPAQRFLLGYHYAYLGYPKQAVDQLDKALELQPKDEVSKQLRNEMNAKLGKAAPASLAPPPSPGIPSGATSG